MENYLRYRFICNMSDSQAAVLEPKEATQSSEQKATAKKAVPKKQPRFNVILWDDPEHTFEYVTQMMVELFRYSPSRGFLLATEVDASGRAICLTTTKEHAELKRDQIQAFGKDPRSSKSRGSMIATIEPVRE
jgi:ATP-dependent Clp protease adaptor protein ClpS